MVVLIDTTNQTRDKLSEYKLVFIQLLYFNVFLIFYYIKYEINLNGTVRVLDKRFSALRARAQLWSPHVTNIYTTYK